MLNPATTKLLKELPLEVLEALLRVAEAKVARQPKSRRVEIKRDVEHHRHCLFCKSNEILFYKATETYSKYNIPKDFTMPIILDEEVVRCNHCYEILSKHHVSEVVAMAMDVITMIQKEWRGQKMPKRREGK